MATKSQWEGKLTNVYVTGGHGKLELVLQVTTVEQGRIVYTILNPTEADDLADKLKDLADRVRRENAKNSMST